MMYFLYNILVVAIGMCLIGPEVSCIYSDLCSEVLHVTLFSMYEMFLCVFLHIGVKCQSLCLLSVPIVWDAKGHFSVGIWNVLTGREGWLHYLVWFSASSIRQHSVQHDKTPHYTCKIFLFLRHGTYTAAPTAIAVLWAVRRDVCLQLYRR